ncbi:GNAT family N-acetyltransferase [Thioclava sp. F42-5]|uniref:GNAT family N-acetyltransferase n=1 Tax=Thioclava sp. F42-5 TaxID=1973005 RepID=UPI00143D1816|nr:GNAT family N-acetyltransferase [Thioclava sp. F42-5]
MSDVSVRMAENPGDFEVAQRLCREWLDWHWRHYPSDWPRGADNPMDPMKFEAIVQKLPTLHERPGGGIIIWSVDGQAVGCVMYREAEKEAGLAEFNRMFVSEGGRGHGLGRLMLEYMFEQLRADGYCMMHFSSANRLTHAAMYEAAGFSDIPHPTGFPDEWRKRAYVMERTLI